MVTALSNAENVIEVSDHFYAIANALHSRLSAQTNAQNKPFEDLYALLTEEYGLRTRAGILRHNVTSHIVSDAKTTQIEFCEALSRTAAEVLGIVELVQLRTLTTTVSTLCVCIGPGKGRVVDFMFRELLRDLDPTSIS